jgi:hypothetical protein
MESTNSTQPDAKTQQLLMAHMNRRAVFRGPGILILVVVEEIRITPVRLRVGLKAIEQLAPSGKGRSSFRQTLSVSGIWEYVTVKPNLWSCSAQGATWHIVPHESSFEAVRRLFETETSLNPAGLFRLADYVSRHPQSDEIPIEIREAAVQAMANDCARPA